MSYFSLLRFPLPCLLVYIIVTLVQFESLTRYCPYLYQWGYFYVSQSIILQLGRVGTTYQIFFFVVPLKLLLCVPVYYCITLYSWKTYQILSLLVPVKVLLCVPEYYFTTWYIWNHSPDILFSCTREGTPVCPSVLL